MKHIIEVKNLVKRYKTAKQNAVDSINFTVNEGEFFAFLGPNGAGKTTTISILTTTLSKTSGDIKIAGYDIDKNQSQVRQNVGIIFQNPSLDQNLTAEENIRLHAILYGMYPYRPTYALMPESYKQKVNQLSDIIGLGKDMFKPMSTFSGGMKRKLEIIRGLMHSPKVLFLDEPTIGLDPISRKALWDYLQEIRRKQNITIFLTTHYLDEAEGADHIAIIDKGQIVSTGTPDDIKRDLVKEFLLIDSHNRHELKQELESLNIPFEDDGRIKINLNGLRAQHIISSIKTKLTVLKTHSPSLEEAYLEVIKHDELQ